MSFCESQLILVTGASSGIGRAIANECLSQGATILACGRDAGKLAAAREESPEPSRWISVVRDFSENMDSLVAWLRDLSTRYGKLWGMAHAAGTALMDSLRLYDLNVARAFFDLNFHVPMLLAKGFADRRVSAYGGAMCFISSASAVFPEKGHLLYGAAKSALACAAKSISQELAPRGLRVHCLAPGIVDSPMQEAAENLMGPDYRQSQMAAYPLGFGQPEDVARMAAFLLSTQARWITGQNFVMAGGRY